MSTTLVQPAAPTSAPADAPEREAALDPERSFLVEAPAGSGKTGLLVQRLLALLCRVDRPESVLALTFTNKATAEMRERVLKALDLVTRDPVTLSDFERTTRNLAVGLLQHDRDLQWNLQQNSHRLNIRTIDSLCGEVARSLPLSSGAVGQMSPVEDAMPLYRSAARAVLLRLGGESDVLNDALRTVLLRRDADLHNVESLLAQMLATREQWGRLIPLTPTELTDAYLDREVKPRIDRSLESVICSVLTEIEQNFPADLLYELTELAAQLAAADGYKGAENPFASCAQLRNPPGSSHTDAEHWALLAKLLLNASSPYGWRKSLAVNHLGASTTAPQKQRLLSLIETLETNEGLHTQLCGLRNLPPRSMPPADWKMTKALFQLLHFALLELRAIFREGGVCDFTERSLAARAALGSSQPAFAPVQPGSPPTASLPQRVLRSMNLQHLLVDEMQDTSSAQYELLEGLTHGWDGSQRTVFLVGDPKQSIYLFRQARVERFLSSMATRSLGDVPLTTLQLTTNFRSAAPLVDSFNALFAPIFKASDGGAIGYNFASASRTTEPGMLQWHIDPLWGDHGQPSRRESRLQVQREQAEHIVHTIHHLREDAPKDKQPTIAILVRAREHAAATTRLLRASGIPFRGVELERLDERPEVLDSLALTRALLHPADRVAWLAVLRAPWCGATLAELHTLAGAEDPESRKRAPRILFRDQAVLLSPQARERVLRTLDTLDAAAGALGRMPVAELVERTGRALGTDLFRTDAERTNVQRFLELLDAAESELRPLDAKDLQVRLARLYAEADTAPGAVDVMTIHKAKGLEWDIVFVPELQRTSAGNSQRLLDWLELPTHSAAQADVLLAPIQPRGTRAAELGCYVQSARRRQTEAELARLLYVVTTRARKHLHLYAAPALNKSTGEVNRLSGTLLGAAWPGAASVIQAMAESNRKTPGELESLQATADEAQSLMQDLSDRQRISDAFDPSALEKPLVLPWLRAQESSEIQESSALPSEPAAEPLLEELERPEGALASRALGTTVHLFLDLLSQHLFQSPQAGPGTLLPVIETWENRVRATLRGMGLHGSALHRQTATALVALRNTVNSPEGVWLLQPHVSASSEQPLLVHDEYQSDIRTLRLDRSFRSGPTVGSSGDDTLWIVDYKTAAPLDHRTAEFLQEQRKHYAPQLRNYARLLYKQSGTPQRIMLALFYPMLPAIDAWAFEPEG